MSRYLVRRILRGLITLWISVTVTFLILRLMPGDVADVMADPRMNQEIRNSILRDFGLDQPLGVQYLIYLKQLLSGNLGTSFRSLLPVSQILLERLPWTLLLTGTAFTVTVLLGIPLGVLAAMQQGKPVDRAINAVSIIGNSLFIPWLAITMLYFMGFRWNLFPIGGAKDIGAEGHELALSVVKHLALPAATLVIGQLAQYVLFMRTSMVETLHEDYIRTARAKGLRQRAVVMMHALKNAVLLPSP